MKKRICCLLSVAMLFVSFALLSAAESEETSGNSETGGTPSLSGTINDYLVAYWNFEGTTPEEQLQDKAPVGAAQDQLTQHGDNVTIADGVAHIPKSDENGFSAVRSDDLIDIESMTIYTKIKYDGALTAWADAVFYDGLYRLYNYQYDATYDDTSMRTSLLGCAHIASALTQPMDSWFYAAVTMETDLANQKAICSIYISNDGIVWDGTTLERDLSEAEVAAVQTAMEAQDRALYIGKSSRLLDRGVDFYFDDIRIYNKALSAQELALIQPNTTELRDPSELPSDPPQSDTEDSSENSEEPSDTDESTTTVPAASGDSADTDASGQSSDAETQETAPDKIGCSSVTAVSLILLLSAVCSVAIMVKKNEE